MHITRIDIGVPAAVNEIVELRFDERVNLFVGPNASGKSTHPAMRSEAMHSIEVSRSDSARASSAKQ